MTIVNTNISDTNKATVSALNQKQDVLPAVTRDYYLHSNASTGALEWSAVQGGGVTDVTINDVSIVTGSIANLSNANMKPIIVSTNTPSGTAPDGTVWIQYEV